MSATLITNGEILSRHQIKTDGIEHLDLAVPVVTGPQAQGDVLIVPVDARTHQGEPVPVNGVAVVRGETEGGNAHILHMFDGECFWAPAPDAADGLVQGWLTVPEGSSATLIHTCEHNVIGIGPGIYEFKRQREFRNEWVRVSD